MIAMFAVHMIMAAIVIGIVIMMIVAATIAVRAVDMGMIIRGRKRISAKNAHWHRA
jgi:uncharacterized membrane protein